MTYKDKRLVPIQDGHDQAWENPTQIVWSVLGRVTTGYRAYIEDPDFTGISIQPEHDTPSKVSSPILILKSTTINGMRKLCNSFPGMCHVYLFDDLTFRVHRWQVIDHGFLLLGTLYPEA